VPLTVTFGLLLVDGRALSWSVVAALALLVLSVCAAANYGYAINELFDVDEDARAGRVNAAAAIGVARVRGSAFVSAVVALLAATAAGGLAALALTVLELCQPLVYSVPPLRLKERGWLAVASDALAAHVYPAALALLAVAHWHVRPVPLSLAVSAVVWSAAAGTRGILSHLLSTAERDRIAGLQTIVHVRGSPGLERALRLGLVPLELAAFVVMLLSCDGAFALWILVALWAVYEMARGVRGFTSVVLRAEGRRYLPFSEERFYKAWGPLALAIDAARVDPFYLALVPVYAVLFRPLLVDELWRVRALIESVRAR